MKILSALSLLILISVSSFASDQDLKINVEKTDALLKKANLIGQTSEGRVCKAEIKTFDDGTHSLLVATQESHIFIGLDFQVYNSTPYSKWSENSFELDEYGRNGEQHLIMKEDSAAGTLMIDATDELRSEARQIICLLPLN